MEKYNKGEIAKNILLGLAAAGFVATVCVFPGVAQIALLFKPKSKKDEYRIKRAFNNLEKQRYVQLYHKGGKEYLKITEKGRKKIQEYKIDSMELSKPKRWDKKWRIVIFDIPEKKKQARDMLNHKLKEMNFYPLQKSTFISPYECRDEIDFIVNYYYVQKHVIYIKAAIISNELFLKRYFGIK